MKEKEYLPEKMILAGRYQKLYQSQPESIRKQVLAVMERLIQEERILCDNGNYVHMCNLLPAMAEYEVLQQNGKSKEQAFEIVSKAMWAALKKTKKSYQRLSHIPGFLLLMKKIVPSLFAKEAGKGWHYEWPESGKNEFYFECTSCIYAQIFQRHNVAELGPMFCHADDINFGSLSGITFYRENTICKGATKCDFLFQKRR